MNFWGHHEAVLCADLIFSAMATVLHFKQMAVFFFFFDLVLEWLCTSIRSAPASRMHAAMFLWPILLVPSEVHVVDICRNMGIRLTPLTYSFRYSWSYEVCVWWTAEISRHGAYESLQTCISKMDIWTICQLTAISVSLFGCWLQ